MYLRHLLVIVSCLWSLSVAADSVLGTPTAIKFSTLNELSGLVKSRRFDDVYWAHNDSGDQARLFAIDHLGKIIFPSFLAGEFHGEVSARGKTPWPGLPILVAANVDWEDIATDAEHLYIADMGNNGNARRDLGVYVIPEPNPRAAELTRPVSFLPIRYPEQREYPAKLWHYDSEALFVFQDKLYFITKHRQPGKIDKFEVGAVLYRLDTRYTDRFNILTRVDTHSAMSVATGADLSPDGRYLAVISYRDLWLFEKPGANDQWLSGTAYRLPLPWRESKQVEAVAWADNEQLVIGNEEGELYWIARKSVPRYVAP
ncbi:hypothetical protein OAC87_05315 [Pseudomonadales bacterium]|nr:hypothetical protein [Pseudomonadales bacterium]MDB9866788.1 hypothetical protein [Pseudomonadales bacterium]MDB9879959.1 hypothetical protein [Pseudomonadales bacterium]MDC1308405.1 hypothetical protein [Pseudomonadales bacterium]